MYEHGIYINEIASPIKPVVSLGAGVTVAIGSAPVHLATEPVSINKPVLVYNMREFQKYFGYSENFEDYTLCEVAYAMFNLYNVSPAVFINVLDPKKHCTKVEVEKGGVLSTEVEIAEALDIETLEVTTGEGSDTAILKVGEDFEAEYAEGVLKLSEFDSDTVVGDSVKISYKKIDTAKIQSSDVIGSVDVSGRATGIELADSVGPMFTTNNGSEVVSILAGTLIAPKFSYDEGVATALKIKAQNVSGMFPAMAIVDLDTSKARNYQDAVNLKTRLGLNDSHTIAAYPKVSLADRQYHLSSHIAALMQRIDAAEGGNIPYISPSNHLLQISSAVLSDGTPVYYTRDMANYLNGNGIVTTLNFGGLKLWGNRTTAYPMDTEPREAFIPVRRMFNFLRNYIAINYLSKIDQSLNRQLVDAVLQNVNQYLAGLTTKGAILGGRLEFTTDDNDLQSLMDGIVVFRLYFTPCSPARALKFTLQYDVSYLNSLFG